MRLWKLLALGVAGAIVVPGAFASEQAAQKAGCLACHTKDKKVIGPSFNEVAAKYKGQADAVTKLTDKVRKGGSGVWGQVPMPAHPAQAIGDDDLKSVLEWVLKG